MIAPKGFSYYALCPSLTQKQPAGFATPKQWITPTELGEVASGLVEKVKESDVEGTKKYEPTDTSWRQRSSDMTSLTAWIVRHPDICLKSKNH